MRIQRVDEHRAMPWANGLGTSYEVASDRNVDGVWTWRVAIAPVVLDGSFSVMPGVDRELVVIEGNGMVLEVDGESVECLPGRVVRFSGDSTTFARLIDKPVVDLGLMTVRGRLQASPKTVHLRPQGLLQHAMSSHRQHCDHSLLHSSYQGHLPTASHGVHQLAGFS